MRHRKKNRTIVYIATLQLMTDC